MSGILGKSLVSSPNILFLVVGSLSTYILTQGEVSNKILIT